MSVEVEDRHIQHVSRGYFSQMGRKGLLQRSASKNTDIDNT